VSQFELLPQPPDVRNNPVWPYWPAKLRTSSSHEEGAKRDWAVSTKSFKGKDGHVTGLVAARVEWKKDPASGQMKMQEVTGTEFEMPADLVLLAMGFVNPVHQGLLDDLGVAYDARGNVRASTEGAGSYRTSQEKVFAAGDMRRGQSLVVWAIREGRQCARSVDEFLMGSSELPR
jgi:glutamate synthase (NADPH/NADH) small chain